MSKLGLVAAMVLAASGAGPLRASVIHLPDSISVEIIATSPEYADAASVPSDVLIPASAGTTLPTPEPGSLPLLIAGLGALLIGRWRRPGSLRRSAPPNRDCLR